MRFSINRRKGAVTSRQTLRVWTWLLPFIAIATLLRFAPLLFAETASGKIDDGLAAAAGALTNPMDHRGMGFPGSAYFYAEDAFGPIRPPQTQAALPEKWRNSAHILPIDIGPMATDYRFIGRTSADRARALACLANAIYYEAGNEPEEGQRAVAQVVLNRLRHAQWPDTICGVIYQGSERDDLACQFSFSCDGSMARIPSRDRWMQAYRVAEQAISGAVFAPAGLATFYHTLAVRPAWSARLTPVAIIGAHIFYRMPGEGSNPARFRDSYVGIETASPSIHAFARPQTKPLIDMALMPPLPTTLTASPSAPSLPMPSAVSGAVLQSAPAFDAPSLPDSQIRAEYRNSGRALN